MASAAVQTRDLAPQLSDDDDDDDLGDAIWDALCEVSADAVSEPEEPDSPASKRSRLSQGEGSHGHLEPTDASPIGALPSEVLRRVLSFLSAEDLTASAASVCRAFCAAADDAGLWRRLFAARWGGRQNSTEGSNLSWKAVYIERDRLELQEIRRRIPPPMQQYYLQMTVGRRSETLKSASRDGAAPPEGGSGRTLAAWRQARGFRPPPLATHGCAGRPTFSALPGSDPPVFLCERCGWAHVCDDACRERMVDAVTGTLVCPISGFCTGRLLTEEEEAAETRGTKDDRGDEAEALGDAGRLARAYADGYSCSDERELAVLCGAHL